MILGRLYKLIRYAIRLLLPSDKPPAAYTMDEVKAILADIAHDKPHLGNWDTSIVDLCKLLDLDPSMAARRDLYAEFNGAGQYTGSAEQNTWLHRQVMEAIARDGFDE